MLISRSPVTSKRGRVSVVRVSCSIPKCIVVIVTDCAAFWRVLATMEAILRLFWNFPARQEKGRFSWESASRTSNGPTESLRVFSSRFASSRGPQSCSERNSSRASPLERGSARGAAWRRRSVARLRLLNNDAESESKGGNANRSFASIASPLLPDSTTKA